MILIDVLHKLPGLEKAETFQIDLKSEGHSAPGLPKIGNKLRWKAFVTDPQKRNILLLTVEHDESSDPTESDIVFYNNSEYLIESSRQSIISKIISAQDDRHK